MLACLTGHACTCMSGLCKYSAVLMAHVPLSQAPSLESMHS